jgi:glutaminyl-peptide cyclotransferase
MKKYRFLLPLWLLLFIVACSETKEPQRVSRFDLIDQNNVVPAFNADSAYIFIENQVRFGTREPNSVGHRQTRDYLIGELRRFAGSNAVFAQDFWVEGYNGETLALSNIIAAFNPQATTRILLAAHWDTRPRAEEDADPLRRENPILGADDGGSGVAVLIELARLMSENMPPVGVDILLFDGEDYGTSGDLDRYFLGARHWSLNPPVPGYSPRFAILLDLVGAKGAVFPKEGFSRRYAGPLVHQIWSLAAEMGYSNYFIDVAGPPVADDHMIVNQVAGIPMIDIIHYRTTGQEIQFPDHWHTHKDNMDIISKETLQAVGDVVTEIIYNRIPLLP